MTTQHPDSRLDTDLGPYRIEAAIGRGGMGVVYLAADRDLDRRVALKLLAPDYADDEAFRARFLRESKLAAAIDHPNIIPIYDAGEIDGTYYLAMRYVEGADLASRLRAGPIEPREAVHLLAQVAGALDAAHAAGLVHRDVKPANLLIAARQGMDRADHVYLTDFGLTKQRGSQTGLTRTGSFLGTLEYVAPEQIEGRAVDGRTDEYALGAIAVECLTGLPPFPHASDLAILNSHLRDAPPSLHERRPELPAAVDAVIARAMAKAIDDRYPDCQTFVDDLRGTLGVTASQPFGSPRSMSRRVPLTAIAIALVAALIIVSLAGVAALTGGLEPSTSPTPSTAQLSATGRASGLPTEDAYPNAAETALLAALPPDLAKTCVRGPSRATATGFSDQQSLASLKCSPPVISGVNSVEIRKYPFLGLSAGRSGFTTEAAISDQAARYGTTGGDCATKTRVNGRWTLGGEDAGAIVCFHDPTSGDAVLWWSYKNASVLVRAVNQRGDAPAVYAYFDRVARFIQP